MSLTGNLPSELIFKNVLRTVNGLPPTNTDYLHEFPTDNFVNSSNMASMVKVITKDEMIYNLEGLDFFAENPDFDLEHIELVCFSNYAIELLKGAISDNNSPLWKIDCNFKDIKLEHTESISKINGSFMNTSNTDMEGSLANIDAVVRRLGIAPIPSFSTIPLILSWTLPNAFSDLSPRPGILPNAFAKPPLNPKEEFIASKVSFSFSRSSFCLSNSSVFC